MHGLPSIGVAKNHVHIARNILPKVDDKVPCSIANRCTGKMFLFSHRNALILNQFSFCMLGTDCCFLPAMQTKTGVIDLPLLKICLHNRAKSDIPVLICEERLFAAIGKRKSQLAPECQTITEVIVPAPPTVSHCNKQLITALL